MIPFDLKFIPMNPSRPHLLRICRAHWCQAKECEKILQHVEHRLKVKLGETTPDGAFTLQDVYCLGMCGKSPAASLDGKLYGDVSPEVADTLIDEAWSAQ